MKYFIIVKSNMRKKKSDKFILFVLITLATLLMYSGINVALNIGSFIADKDKTQNAANIAVFSESNSVDEIESIIEKQEGMASFETERCLLLAGAKYRNISNDESLISMDMFFLDMDQERTINDFTILKKGKEVKSNSIILPAYTNITLGYETGDMVEIAIGEKSYTFEIYGFVEDVMFAVPTNVSKFRCYIPNETFESMYNEDSSAILCHQYSLHINDTVDLEDTENELNTALGEGVSDYQLSYNMILNSATMESSTAMYANIVMALIAVFGALLVIISMLVIEFNVIFSIENNMANIGMLKANGYLGKQLLLATLIEFLSVTILGVITGLFLGVVASGFVKKQISAAVGLFWVSHVDVKAIIISSVVVLVLITLVCLFASRKYFKILPLDALRHDSNNNKSKKNVLPLSKGHLSVNLSLALKNMCQQAKQNIFIIIVVGILSFTSVLMYNVYYNFSINPEIVIQLVGFEKPSIAVNYQSLINKGRDEEFCKNVANLDGVKNTIDMILTDATVDANDKNETFYIDVYSNTKDLTIDTVVRGRRPELDNEIMLTNIICDSLDVTIGDSVYVTMNGERTDFIVVGISQQISHLGRRGMLTEKGMQRIIPKARCNTLYVYLDNEDDVSDVMPEIEQLADDSKVTTTDYVAFFDGTLNSFGSVLALLSVLFLGITIIVVIFLIWILIKMKLVRDIRKLGIERALGYTTKQLMMQIVLSYIPVVTLGSLIGVILGIYQTDNAFTLIMSFAGIEKCTLAVSLLSSFGIFLVIVLVAFIIALISSHNISKIEPCKMIKE